MSKKTAAVLLIVISVLLVAISLFAADVKDIRYPFKNADPVVFSHTVHLQKYRNNCRMCHNTFYDLRNKKSYKMADMEKGKSCGACHNGTIAFNVATNKDCSRCHSGKPRSVAYNIKGTGKTSFSHDVHIAVTGGACKSCHDGKLYTGSTKPVTMLEMEKGKSCGACHNDGKDAFTVAGNCNRCHDGLKLKEINYNVKGAASTKFSHDFHTQVYQCADCHTKTYQYRKAPKVVTMAEMETGKSCGACHNNGKDAFTVAGNCEKCHSDFKPDDVKYKTIFGDAPFSHEFHTQMYKCEDCHTKTFPYTAFATDASMNDMVKGKSCGACHNKGKDAFAVNECLKCHQNVSCK